jgi:nitroimidazol reductase NimA-like FMN-containing flavoprotein (pyridoxamine 5'-phosphate oxidase superfamily)
MRKANREVQDRRELLEILEKCDVCRIGLTNSEAAYIVPMNFGFEWPEDGLLTLWFHCAREGRKLDMIRENGNVCFEMDCGHELKHGATACAYSMNFESIIGYGRICVEVDAARRIHGMETIMRKYSRESAFQFADAALAQTVALRLDVREFTGKRLQK